MSFYRYQPAAPHLGTPAPVLQVDAQRGRAGRARGARPARYCSQRHRMPCDTSLRGAKRLWMTRRSLSGWPYLGTGGASGARRRRRTRRARHVGRRAEGPPVKTVIFSTTAKRNMFPRTVRLYDIEFGETPRWTWIIWDIGIVNRLLRIEWCTVRWNEHTDEGESMTPGLARWAVAV
jgi:hypothetical protein